MKTVTVAAGRTIALLAWPLLSLAAEQTIRRADPTMLPWITWALVVGLALVGYLASSAEHLFGWLDNRGWTWFGQVVQRFFAALGAGVLSFLMGLYLELPMLACVIGVMPSAYMGEHYLRKLGERRTERDAAAVDKAEGR